MPSKLHTWFHRKKSLLNPQPQTQNPREDPTTPPQLPAHRAITLTPPASSPSPNSNTPIFNLLPPETRRRILIEAFGERTVHIEHSFAHPRVLSHTNPEKTHCGISSVPNRSGGWRTRDTSRPKAWRWFSCVCHRDFEWCVRGPGKGTGVLTEPSEDTCLEGTAACCRWWSGGMPGKCYVGVLGWILACRQAYVEGIGVLYATNTFSIFNVDMMHTLPKLIRAEHREMISSVEMIWRLNPRSRGEGLDALSALLRRVPETFPNLRNLYLYPAGIWNIEPSPDNEIVVEFGTDILELVDGMVRKFGPQLLVCDIVIPFRKFHAHWVDGIGKGYKYEHGGTTRLSGRIWRPLVRVQQDNEGDESLQSGYWLREGPDDVRYPFAHMVPP
ncbi:uncharacterized protein GGS22DRAFT_134893 [Annulohypoxylon maeteangense]|uniref:uncharacterized protein n=1 Tax=Annulohypoxylon maeteangense TaxID=1927788 RepID=UPI002008C018|nr:uncharacterized protein GGS22DRAFT_134893 [Annulohypoxylon maeteangense]KAI0885825.1 hypothetical protein GGS22DRAFT_134893 [Annulohypoxylon maeteangense]